MRKIIGRMLPPILQNYSIHTTKPSIHEPITIVFLSDLHCEDYGDHQKELLQLTEQAHPDFVLFGGDTFDERVSWKKATEALREFSSRYPCFYTPGNHEIKTGTPEYCCELAKECGAVLLSGSQEFVDIHHSTILLSGVEDPLRNEETHARQLAESNQFVSEHPDLFSVLITHRPERVSEYHTCASDLILTGHAHGGQWILPGILNGFFAPDQGLFPKYAGGEYLFEHNRMICSRGLARRNTHIPRIFNNPEVVAITVLPMEDAEKS